MITPLRAIYRNLLRVEPHADLLAADLLAILIRVTVNLVRGGLWQPRFKQAGGLLPLVAPPPLRSTSVAKQDDAAPVKKKKRRKSRRRRRRARGR